MFNFDKNNTIEIDEHIFVFIDRAAALSVWESILSQKPTEAAAIAALLKQRSIIKFHMTNSPVDRARAFNEGLIEEAIMDARVPAPIRQACLDVALSATFTEAALQRLWWNEYSGPQLLYRIYQIRERMGL